MATSLAVIGCELLVVASFAMAGRQDWRKRKVTNIVWLPAVAGVVLSFFVYPLALVWVIVAVGISSVAWLAFLFRQMGPGDAVGITLIMFSPLNAAFVIIWACLFALLHLAVRRQGHEALSKPVMIPKEQKEREPWWMPTGRPAPEGMVEVKYGVPTVSYLALGYVVAFLF